MSTNTPITKIFLIRHGETLWNSEHRIQGHIDSPLTPTGLAQAQALAQRLQKQSFAALYSSDLGRAYQTAQYLAKTTGLPIIVDPRLRERNLGCLQGLTRSEAQQQFPEEYQLYKTLDPDYLIPNGESLRQFRQRCISCLEEIVQKHPGEHILVVSHGGVLINVFKHILQLPYDMPRRFEIFNVSLNVFSYQADNWKLETWGDISHWSFPKHDPIFDLPIIGGMLRLLFSESMHILWTWFIVIGIIVAAFAGKLHFKVLFIAGWIFIISGFTLFSLFLVSALVLLILGKIHLKRK